MNKDDKLLDHDYDGIQELDNPLPRWWVLTFYASIVFSVLYVGYYHLGEPRGSEKELQAGLAELKEQQRKNAPAATGPDESILAELLKDKSKLIASEKLFGEKCASCHGPKGEGQIGPNLTDNFWIHGDGSAVAIFRAVSDGVPDKGMPPWGAMLKPDELYAVTAFVKNLEGTRPANAKAPQGTEVKQSL